MYNSVGEKCGRMSPAHAHPRTGLQSTGVCVTRTCSGDECGGRGGGGGREVEEEEEAESASPSLLLLYAASHTRRHS